METELEPSVSYRPLHGLFSELLGAFRTQAPLSATPPYSSVNLAILEDASDQVLERLTKHANNVQRTLHLGTSAVGTCMALAAPEAMDSQQCSPATVEAIGWLLAELADLSSICHHFEATASRILLARSTKVNKRTGTNSERSGPQQAI